MRISKFLVQNSFFPDVKNCSDNPEITVEAAYFVKSELQNYTK